MAGPSVDGRIQGRRATSTCALATFDLLSRRLLTSLLLSSQGTQDIIAFAHLPASSSLPGLSPSSASRVAGYTLLAPASDRVFLEQVKNPAEIQAHLSPPPNLTLDDFIPRSASQDPFGPARITYRRWRSLAGRPPPDALGDGDGPDGAGRPPHLDLDVSEDFFSPDLPDRFLREAVFADVGRPLQVLLCEDDETFDKGRVELGAWLGRLEGALPERARSGKSGIVEGADHSVTGLEAQGVLRGLVVGFLEGL